MDLLKSTPLETVSRGVTERGGDGFEHMLVRTGEDGKIDTSLLSQSLLADLSGVEWKNVSSSDIGFSYDADDDIAMFTVRLTSPCCVLDRALLEEVANSGRGVRLWEGGPYWRESNVGAADATSIGYVYSWGSRASLRLTGASDSTPVDIAGNPYPGAAALTANPDPLYPDLSGKTVDEMVTSGHYSRGVTDAAGHLTEDYDCAWALGDGWRLPTAEEVTRLVTLHSASSATSSTFKSGGSSISLPYPSGHGLSPLYMSATTVSGSSEAYCLALTLSSSSAPAVSNAGRFGTLMAVRPVRDYVDLSRTTVRISYVNGGGSSSHLLMLTSGGVGSIRSVHVNGDLGTFTDAVATADDIVAAAAQSSAGGVASSVSDTRTCYVAKGASGGDGSSARPFGTIAAAVESGAAVIRLLPGTYSGELVALTPTGSVTIVGTGPSSRIEAVTVPRGTVVMYGVEAGTVSVTENATVVLWSTRITQLTGRAATVLVRDMGSVIAANTVTDCTVSYTGTDSVTASKRLEDGTDSLTVSGTPKFNGRPMAFVSDYTALTDAIQANAAAIAGISSTLAGINTGPDPAIAELSATVASLDATLRSTVSNVNTKVNWQQNTVSSVLNMVNSVKGDIDTVSTSVVDLQTSMTEIKARVTVVEEAAAANATALAALTTQVASLVSSLGSTSSLVTALGTSLAGLDTRLSEVEAAIAGLSADDDD